MDNFQELIDITTKMLAQFIDNEAKVKALVDLGNGIENRAPITDIIYDENSDTVIIYVDGRNLEY